MGSKNDYYMEMDYPNLGKVSVLEGKGVHYFNALSNSKGDSGLIIKYLMLSIVFINEKLITKDQLDNLLIKDVLYFNEIISQMMCGNPII